VRVTILASGSSGNAILIEDPGEDVRVLVDCGLSPRRLATRLDGSGAGVRLDEITGVVVSHEHGDHAGGVAALASAGLPVWATEGTARALELPAARPMRAGQRLAMGTLEIDPVTVPHDAAEPVAFVIQGRGGKLGVLLDCGAITPDIEAAFRGCEALVIEANHDTTLLRNGPYPAQLKRRIGGGRGHLSNDHAAQLIARLSTGGKGPRLVVLAHLSAENNRPQLARAALDRALGTTPKPVILIAPGDRPLGGFELAGRGQVRTRPAGPARQLSLAFAAPQPRSDSE
jgi:phosphoribosyl 1,2-cyclic phosphodiesterase